MVGRAQVVGTGLIGGSIALGLHAQGWHVTGRDADEPTAGRARDLRALDAVGEDLAADITFVCTPAGSVVEEARRALDVGDLAGVGGVVTDVAGVKASIVEAVRSPRFVGGHPMAGSERDGIEGARADLFRGATWVLTPTDATDPQAYATVRQVVTSLGAFVLAVPPARHDELVAVVSHVPHLTAAALMNLAADTASEHGTLLRMAAGGFRDMTRIASGHPAIWPDVTADNRAAILEVIDRLTASLDEVRHVVQEGDRGGLVKLLERARDARANLPVGAPAVGDLVELVVPVADRPGMIAEVTTLLGEMGVNIFDLEIAHSAEGESGVLVMVVDAPAGEAARQALSGRGFSPAMRKLAG